MKEAKTIIIIFSLILIFMTLSIFIFPFCSSGIAFDIIISIITGLFVSILTAVCQYFVIRGKIIDNVFNCYLRLYKAIYSAEKYCNFFGYNVRGIWKELNSFAPKFSEYLGDFNGFIPNNYNKIYKKLNPNPNLNFNVFNVKNIMKLIFPCNHSKFREIVLPAKKELEIILLNINRKKFKKDMNEYANISKKLYK